MKKINIEKIILMALLVFCLNSCQTDSDNINAANENTVFTTKQGIVEATTGLKQLYSTLGIRLLVETPAITTREAASATPVVAIADLEQGGSSLQDTSPNIVGLWGTMLRVIKNSNEVITACNTVPLEVGTKSGLVSYAKIYKAMSIGTLSQNFEKVIIEPNKNNEAQFVTRQQGYLYAIQLLNEAKADIIANPVSTEVTTLYNSEVNLPNTLNALIARYSLFAGNYTDAINTANLVSLTTKSVFKYDGGINPNPIFTRMVQQTNNSKPIADFGLPSAIFTVAATDGRRAFYLGAASGNSLGGGSFPFRNLTGFFTTSTSDIPVYLVDEMKLIKAEAHIRKATPDLAAATLELNSVLTTTDVFGVNANLPAYSGPNTATDLLLEIYKNRRVELFFTGMSLEDSRRFARPQPTQNSTNNFTDERNRNFYPYPVTERNNNPNTPGNPAI
jgi:starch-binding outer membrane protein, SusD/RagB family